MHFEGCSEDYLYLFLFSTLDTFISCTVGLVTIIDIHCTYFLCMLMYVSFTYPCMCCFFFFFIHMVLITCMQSIISVSHRCLDKFCLKCFRNTGCKSLLAKFFKSLCYDRFYCI